jgi:hypothetical protein
MDNVENWDSYMKNHGIFLTYVYSILIEQYNFLKL